eukprot:4074710-Amphidinium_carterae.1
MSGDVNTSASVPLRGFKAVIASSQLDEAQKGWLLNRLDAARQDQLDKVQNESEYRSMLDSMAP